MTNFEFAVWLCGFLVLELEQNLSCLNYKQLLIIKNHLNLVKEVDSQLDKRNAWLSRAIKSAIEEDEHAHESLKELSLLIKKKYAGVLRELFS